MKIILSDGKEADAAGAVEIDQPNIDATEAKALLEILVIPALLALGYAHLEVQTALKEAKLR